MKGGRRHVAEASARALAQIAPAGWLAAQLGDVAELQPGYAFDSEWFAPNGVRLLRGTNIIPGGTRWEDVVHLALSRIEKFAPYELNAGDIVIAMDRPFISTGLKVARLAVTDCPALLLQRVGRFRSSAAISTDFLHYYLQGTTFSTHTGGLATGTQLPHISKTDIETCPMLVPPLNEQRRIVAKLDTIFEQTRAARTRLERLPNLFVQLKRSILAAAFRGDLTVDWRAAHPDVEPASALAARIRGQRDDRTSLPPDTAYSSELPEAELPSTWFVALTANVGSVQLGRQLSAGKYTGALHPYVRVANVADDRLSFDDLKEMEFSPKELGQYLLRPGDILLSEGQSLDRLGQSAMYRAGDPAVCYQKTLNRFRATEAGPLPEYAQLFFRFCMHTGVFRAAGSITTNIAHLTQEKLRRIPFALCPLEEQRVLVERVRGALARLEDLQAGVSSVRARFASVEQAALAKAFRGELVDQDPNDEPAAALIERVRALVDMRTDEDGAKPRGRLGRAKSPKMTTRPKSRANAAESTQPCKE